MVILVCRGLFSKAQMKPSGSDLSDLHSEGWEGGRERNDSVFYFFQCYRKVFKSNKDLKCTHDFF